LWSENERDRGIIERKIKKKKNKEKEKEKKLMVLPLHNH
jgi:hypothetical protein